MESAARRPRVSPWVWSGLLAVGAVVPSLTWNTSESGSSGDIVSGVMFMVAIVVLALLGGVLRIKVPESPFGLLFLITGWGLLLSGLSGEIPEATPVDPGFSTYAAVIFQSTLGLFALFYPIPLMLYLFPTGRFMNRRWTWAGWFGAILAPLVFVSGALANELDEPFGGEDGWTIPNPIGAVPNQVGDTLSILASVGLVFVMLGGIVAIVLRYRQSSVVVRTQIKWLMYPGIVFVVAYLLIATGSAGSTTDWGGLLFVTPFLLVPVAITIAITRYRLFEIDRIISRTMTYLLVAGLLALVFVAGAVWLPATVLGESPPLFVAGSTLAVAALFNPLRLRVQRIIDRRFNRSAYEAEVLAEEFGSTLQQSLTVEDVAGRWVETVESALEPQSIGLWVSVRDRG